MIFLHALQCQVFRSELETLRLSGVVLAVDALFIHFYRHDGALKVTVKADGQVG